MILSGKQFGDELKIQTTEQCMLGSKYIVEKKQIMEKKQMKNLDTNL